MCYRDGCWIQLTGITLTIYFIPVLIVRAMHKVLTYIENRAVSGVFRTIDPPPPLHSAIVSSPRTKGVGVGGGGYTLAGRWKSLGGQYFRKTPGIGFASFSIIPLRSYGSSSEWSIGDSRMGPWFSTLSFCMEYVVVQWRSFIVCYRYWSLLTYVHTFLVYPTIYQYP